MSTFRYSERTVRELARSLNLSARYDSRGGYTVDGVPLGTAREAMAYLWGYDRGLRDEAAAWEATTTRRKA